MEIYRWEVNLGGLTSWRGLKGEMSAGGFGEDFSFVWFIYFIFLCGLLFIIFIYLCGLFSLWFIFYYFIFCVVYFFIIFYFLCGLFKHVN